jgi:hypothetical protein
MAQAEDPGDCSGANELRVCVQDDASYGPGSELDEDEKSDDRDGMRE